MTKDPIVEEVRAIRQRHAARFGNDLDAIVADLQAREKQMKRTMRRPATRPQKRRQE